MNGEFQKSALDAQIALAYASEKGLLEDSDEKEITEIITETKHNLENISQELEIRFWTAYSKLTKKILPASVASILAVEDISQDNKWWRFMFPKLSDARKTIRYYQRLGFFFLIVMLIVQIYWIVGAGFMADLKTLPDVLDKLNLDKRAREEILQENAATDLQIQIMETKIMNIQSQLDSYTKGIRGWYTSIGIILPLEKIEVIENESETEFRITRYCSFILEVIQTYILPILYGLLGAFAYILRKLSKELSEKSFSVESKIKHVLRLHLGAMAGLSVGWFFGDTASDTINISSLSPLALAFLAGYNVDLVFTLMDRFIESLSSKSPEPKKSTET
jgi:hypothetical protein